MENSKLCSGQPSLDSKLFCSSVIAERRLDRVSIESLHSSEVFVCNVSVLQLFYGLRSPNQVMS